MKTHVIMPMGGAGTRFFKNGYVQPKPLIEIKGKPFLYWATMSVTKYIEVADLTFVVLQKHIDDFGIDTVIKRYFPWAKISVLPDILPGPVFTSLKGIDGIEDDLPILINDCDHMFRCNEFNRILNSNSFSMEGALLTFKSSEPQFSYVKYDDNGKIVGTIEKQVVSDHAICGAYAFKNAQLFKKMASIYTEICPYNECFMSGLYNVMCDEKMEIRDFLLDFHVEFGTPKEYEQAKESEHFNELL